MSFQDAEPLRRRCSVTPDASLAKTSIRRRALQTVFDLVGIASSTPRSNRLERRPSTLRIHSGPSPDEGNVCAQGPFPSWTRFTRPPFRDVTIASAGVWDAPSRFRRARGESTTVQERFGFDPLRAKEADLGTR